MFKRATDNIRDAMDNVGSTFSSRKSTGLNKGSFDFINTNGIVGKLIFLLLVIIGFLVVFRIGVYAVMWMMSPAHNPYLVYGTIDGTNSLVIEQSASVTGASPLLRSNNQSTGAEFTWSTWLYFSDIPQKNSYAHIFSKGNQPPNDASLNNTAASGTSFLDSPGIYAAATSPASTSGATYNQLSLFVCMAQFNSNINVVRQIDNIPIRQWVHVAVRLENTILDTYVQGTITDRYIFQDQTPKQSFGNVFICQNGGFPGKLSNLRYYDSALSVFSIQSIVYWGPNFTPASTNSSTTNNGSNFFLSNTWYASRY